MTSSIYPLIPFFTATTITTPGSGYTSTPTVTFESPPSGGRTATGTANIANGVINAISAISATVAYTEGEEVTLSSNGSGIGATGIATISASGVVSNIDFTSRGSGFVGGGEEVTITGVSSTANDATFTVTTVANNAVSSITLTNSGLGYTSLPDITITGGGGSAATAESVLANRATPIPENSDILTSDIEITSAMVSPGGGGILRLYFSVLTQAGAATSIMVVNNGDDKGLLNADNSFQIASNGYFRFDIDVEAGDSINIQPDGTAGVNTITGINFTRAHLIQFGA